MGGKLQEQATRLQQKRSHRRVAAFSICMKSPLTGLSGIDAAAAAAAADIQRLQQLPPNVSHARTSTPEQRVKSKKTVKRGIYCCTAIVDSPNKPAAATQNQKRYRTSVQNTNRFEGVTDLLLLPSAVMIAPIPSLDSTRPPPPQCSVPAPSIIALKCGKHAKMRNSELRRVQGTISKTWNQEAGGILLSFPHFDLMTECPNSSAISLEREMVGQVELPVGVEAG